jgi:hypothetical protein
MAGDVPEDSPHTGLVNAVREAFPSCRPDDTMTRQDMLETEFIVFFFL